jgi:hypothetical protein
MEEKKIYIIPEVTSYTDEDILAELGKAHAINPVLMRDYTGP